MFAFFSVMLTTSAPLQNNTILTSSSDFSSNSAFQYAYATSDGGGDEGGGNDEGNGDEGSEESGDEGSGDANDESEASDTNSSNSTGDPSSFFGDEGTPESLQLMQVNQQKVQLALAQQKRMHMHFLVLKILVGMKVHQHHQNKPMELVQPRRLALLAAQQKVQVHYQLEHKVSIALLVAKEKTR